jgi:aryl-alcohol dehydrogenase-like predicted oxidoreductase
MGTVVWSPLAMGVLTGKYRSVDELPPGSRATGDAASTMGLFMRQEVLDAVQGLREVADDAGCTMAQLALAWCLRTRDVSGVIVGASRPEQLDETAAAADMSLDAGVFDAVDRVLARLAITEA